MSNIFCNSREITMGAGSNFSTVGRDQYNIYYSQTAQREEKEKKRTEFDQVRKLKRGDYYLVRDICVNKYPRDCFGSCMSRGIRCWDCYKFRWKADRTFCVAEVDECPGRVYTAVLYSGPDARKALEKDFWTYSTALTSQVAQAYAVDIGRVPSLLLRNELLPFVHFVKRVDRLGLWYLGALLVQWACCEEELWIDSTRGVICRGPKGPVTDVGIGGHLVFQDAPTTVDFLQDDVVLRFMASMKSEVLDRAFVNWAPFRDEWTWKGYRADVRAVRNYAINPNTAQVFSTLGNTPIAIAHLRWHSSNTNLKTPLERTLLGNGLVRFRLGDGEWIWLEMVLMGMDAERAWLSQAWSVFHALGITVDDDLENFTLVQSCARLEGSLSSSQVKRQRRLQQPIYLFVHPLPANLPLIPLNGRQQIDGQTPSLHFWSFQEDGNSPLSPHICHSLGLPTALRLYCSIASESWTNDTYKIIRQYQVLRGFDPTTTTFAQHLRDRIIFQPIRDLARFKEINEEQNSRLPEFLIEYTKYDSYGRPIRKSDEVDPSNSDSDSEGSSSPRGQQDPGDSLSSDSVHIQDGGFIINSDHSTDQRQWTDAGCRVQSEGIERRDLLDQTPERLPPKSDTTIDDWTDESLGQNLRLVQPLSNRDTFPANIDYQAYLTTDMGHLPASPAGHANLSARQGFHSLPSTSMDPFWADVSFSTHPQMATVPFHPAQPIGSLGTSQPEMETTTYEDTGAEFNSAYAEPSIYSVARNDTVSTAGNTLEHVEWSRTLQSTSFTADSRLYNPPVFGLDSTVIQPLDSTVHAPVYPISTVGPADAYVSFSSYHTEESFALQRQSSPYVPITSFSHGQSGSPAGDADWNCWGDFDLGSQGYE
ncbi:hypothetical protein PM082_013976 [Marasmius tenuissimus]|nr:hypothetical protein PM082_013976 [Marasmius tenuissimus]